MVIERYVAKEPGNLPDDWDTTYVVLMDDRFMVTREIGPFNDGFSAEKFMGAAQDMYKEQGMDVPDMWLSQYGKLCPETALEMLEQELGEK